MTALTAERDTPARYGQILSVPLAAGAVVFAGGIAALTLATGYARAGGTATGLAGLGRVAETVSNVGGANGAARVSVELGVFRYTNSGGGDAITLAHFGQPAYLVDDQTVAATSGGGTRSPAGIVHDVDRDGVWIAFGVAPFVAAAGALLVANNLSDVANSATARANLGLTLGTHVQAYDARLARVARQNDLLAVSANGALATSGVNLVAGGTGLAGLTLAAPVPGDRCEVVLDTLTSGTCVVSLAAGVTVDGTNNVLTFNAAGDRLVLIYESATRWRVVENVSVALSAA